MPVVPQFLEELVALLDLERLDADLFRGRQPRTSAQRVFGGQVAGQALVAASRTVDEALQPHSLHGYFLLAGDTGTSIIYDVARVRDGRSFSTRRVVARQHGREIFYLTASFQRAEAGWEHQVRIPDVPPPEDCPTLADVYAQASGRSARSWAREWAALDVRYVGDSRPGGSLEDPGRPAVARVWVRAAGELPDDPVLHRSVLAYASDLTLLAASLVPHGVVIGHPSVQAASIDHALWFHRGARADRWLLHDQHSPFAGGGRGFTIGALFEADGVLVASTAQEGLIRRLG